MWCCCCWYAIFLIIVIFFHVKLKEKQPTSDNRKYLNSDDRQSLFFFSWLRCNHVAYKEISGLLGWAVCLFAWLECFCQFLCFFIDITFDHWIGQLSCELLPFWWWLSLFCLFYFIFFLNLLSLAATLLMFLFYYVFIDNKKVPFERRYLEFLVKMANFKKRCFLLTYFFFWQSLIKSQITTLASDRAN